MINISPIFYIYGFILIAGGWQGYSKKTSKISLIMGISMGVASILIGFLGRNNLKPSLIAGLALSLGVTAIFVMRYRKTKKPMPALPMIAISALTGIADVALLILNR
jgi:uncharacterized membrane protein (UPF0136 family)